MRVFNLKIIAAPIESIRVKFNDSVQAISPDSFEEIFGIKYTNNLHIDPDIIDIHNVEFANMSVTDRLALILNYLRNRKYYYFIDKGITANVYISYINERIGYGLFADEDIKKNSWIGEYSGRLHLANGKREESEYGWLYPTMKNNIFTIEASKYGNYTRYVNHSFKPNVVARSIYFKDYWHFGYVAIKAISKNEQLLVNYGDFYWERRLDTPEMTS
ncbi:MAG: hypothetical protein A2X42_02225 [Candidatus Margulisbacteria bacterium GWF2_38_17]|nr:MAG: hypothetical protein A2X43_09540 [Candidatus Margulisbacteria bacterium GWD2_39_127]OGI02868.1 MAG: hypothetical protein A2X42_02225 [Candidatus Margulisbacteria bacterium GWF2_38_17]OGI09649.1 MAG: hypothetical protein A2X41_04935 [Candidatus Margulisbacteria bacterium GWE2_39_32]